MSTADLVTRWQQHHDVRARDQLLRDNQRLVHWVASKVCRKHTGLEHDDAVQAASIGFLRAVDSYDPACGTPFAGYACIAMRREIGRSAQRFARAVALPANAAEVITAIGRAKQALVDEGVEQPSNDQIAERMGGISGERVARILGAGQCSSLDAPLKADEPESITRLDLLRDPEEYRPDVVLEAKDNAEGVRTAVQKAIEDLPPRQGQIARLHLLEGLDGTTIGEALGISRQAVGLSLGSSLPKLRTALMSNAHVAEALAG